MWGDSLDGVDLFVAAIGTGCIVTGTRHYFKMINNNIRF
ncbi:hypothetical protein SLEP1_g39370 [Rubroshorea leprosula]|uniref:Uncharacterized protein n=1 Tax=Rubroshorea leprosula TaxID=152421 RepID=A0AAV5L067_9ROSI|nr:hypothetical protein SLEP1_g39370 [Rubroshorea leprosula]